MTKLRIKEVISERGMTIAQVAKKLGILPSALSQSVNGNPRFGRLCELADVLGCEVTEFFTVPTSNTFRCPHCGKEISITANPE